MQFVAVSLLCSAALVFGDVHYAETLCDTQRIQSCFNAYIEKWGKQDQASLFIYNRNADQMEEMCSDFRNVKDCTDGLIKKCDETTKSIYNGLFNSIDYMCGPGLQVYLKHRVCFAQSQLAEKAKVCNKTATDTFNHINDQLRTYQLTAYYSSSDMRKLNNELCRATDKLLSCMTSATESLCGKEAANFVETLTEKMISPVIQQVNCNEKGGFAVWYAIAAAAALLSLALGGWCVGMWVQKNRHRTYTEQVALVSDQGDWDSTPPSSQAPRTTDRTGNAMPPSYDPISSSNQLPPGAENINRTPLVNVYSAGSHAIV